MDPELNNKDLKIHISATGHVSKNSTVNDQSKNMANRVKTMAERTALTFQEKDRAKVLEKFSYEIIESPVTYEGARVSALRMDKPAQKSIKPSQPELLDSAPIDSGLFISVSMAEPGICYQLMYQGEKQALEANMDKVIKAFKTIKFLRK